MKCNINKAMLFISLSVFSVACGKGEPTPAQQQKSLQGKWKLTQTSRCGTVISTDPDIARLIEYTDDTAVVTDSFSLACKVLTTSKVTFLTSTSFSIDSISEMKFLDSAACKKHGLDDSSLEAIKVNFKPMSYTYSLSGDSLDIKTDQVCKKADGTSDFVHEIYTRQ